jgi:hydrogenase nickel incorporation protein HypB
MHQVIDMGVNLLHANQHQADHNQADFDRAGVFCFNLMSSPGAGKTALLEATLGSLVQSHRVAIIEGDMTTQLDAERLRKYGIPVIGINTGRACHLDARMVQGGIRQLEQEVAPLTEFDLILVENVGNLVCPAEFAVGEHAKIALLSVTEGEDKPLKYPLMFREADCLVITKVDLMPHLQFDQDTLIDHVRQMNPTVPIFWVSAQTGAGLSGWVAWIQARIALGSSAKAGDKSIERVASI